MSQLRKKNVVILVPSYRCETTIEDTLRSILEQGPALDRVHSVVLAEDASGDRTPEIARQIWKHSTPLVILDPKVNRGEYVNVNEAVASFPPSIEWFLIIHGDNIANPGWLSTLLDRVEKADPNLATMASSWDSLYEDGRIEPGENLGIEKSWQIHGSKESVRDTLFSGCWWHISACAIRISAFKMVGGLPKGFFHKGDWDFLMRVMGGGWKVEYLPVPLIQYRDNAQGSSARSFVLMNDIHEALTHMQKHAWAMGIRETLRFHFRLFVSTAKRTVRLTQRKKWKGVQRALPLCFRMMKSLLRLLTIKTFERMTSEGLLPGVIDWMTSRDTTTNATLPPELFPALKEFRPERIIHTGTHRGETALALNKIAPKTPMMSCEIRPRYYWFSRIRTRQVSRIHLIEGDSSDVLRRLLMETDLGSKRCLFYLSTYQSGRSPVWNELSLIRTYCKNWIAVVDGKKFARTEHDFLTGEFVAWLGERMPFFHSHSEGRNFLWIASSEQTASALQSQASLTSFMASSAHSLRAQAG